MSRIQSSHYPEGGASRWPIERCRKRPNSGMRKNEREFKILEADPFIKQLRCCKLLRTLRLFVAFAIFTIIITPRSIAAGDNIPAFTVQGVVSCEKFSPFNTNCLSKMAGTVLFSYSNRIWRVQFTYQTAYLSPLFHVPNLTSNQMNKLVGTMIDCKRIPDGIRQIITPPTATNTITPGVANKQPQPYAVTKSIPYPEMADQVLFLPWLALCPSPELPLINSNHIRFNFAPQFLDKSQNVGDMNVSYISPEETFLSKLEVTNNGTLFQLNGSVMKFPSPYANGFRQFSYNVLETTNCNGKNFPLKTVLYQFDPSPNGTSADDIYPALITRLSIQQIDFGDNHLVLATAPTNLVAVDSRPAGLNNGITVNYSVFNDQWPSPTNKQVEQLANLVRSLPNNKIKWETEHSRNRNAVLVAFAIITLIPLFGIIWRTKHNNKMENK